MNKFLTNLGQTFSDDEKAVIKTKLESILGTDQTKMAWYPTIGNDGTIQWGLSAYSTQAPNPANIKGPQGDSGKDGEDGEPGTSVTIDNIETITGGRKVIFSDGNEITIYDGKDGAGVAIKGTVDNVADLPSTAENGDAYIVKNDDGKLYVYANGWPTSGVAFTGPKGADGDTPTLAFIENSEKTGIDIFVNGGEEPVNTIPYATDGHSPIITTTATSTGNDIYIDGTKAFSVTNGTNGNDGKDGYTPEATTTAAPADASHLNGGTKVTLSWPADATWLSPVSFTAWNGNNGTNGTTWKPSVSDAGVLSWTSETGAPTTANIKGPQGLSGDTWKPTVNEDGDLSWTTAAGTPTTANIKGPAGNDGVTPTVTVTAATSTTHPNGGTEVKFEYGDGDERNTSFTAWNGNDGMAGDLPAAPTEAGKYVLNKPAEGDASWVDYEADAYTLTGDGKFISVTENAGTVTVGLTTTDITGDNPYVMTTAGWTNGTQYYAHVKTVGDIDSVASAINIITHNNSTGTNYNKISGYGYNSSKQQTTFEAFLLPNHWTRMFSSGANATAYAGTFVKVTPGAASNNAWYDIEPNITASETAGKKFAWDPTNNTWAAISEGGSTVFTAGDNTEYITNTNTFNYIPMKIESAGYEPTADNVLHFVLE